MKPDLSVIIPAYNEEDFIENTINQTIDTLSLITNQFEIIIVDDGSTDKTAKIVQKISLRDKRIKILNNGINIGKGHSILYATQYIDAEKIAIIDADLNINPNQLLSFVYSLETYDICIASKKHPTSSYNAPRIRKYLSNSYNILSNIMLGTNFTDTQTGFKAIKTKSLKLIAPLISMKQYSFDLELLLCAKANNFTICELPIIINQNASFRFQDIITMFADLIKIFVKYRVMNLYKLPPNVEKNRSL